MDIVSRLRKFMEYRQIPITQFADSCNIPRPTMSQLLNGRNKKVSDELIGKIHEAYPSLSVLWLMFGEGDMLNDANIKTSEPQNSEPIAFGSAENTGTQRDGSPTLFSDDILAESPEKSETGNHTSEAIDFTEGKLPEENLPSSGKSARTTISFTNSKRVVNIIVVYSDTTVESFVPASSLKDINE